MIDPFVQVDPLNSPHPVPWNWVMATFSTENTVVGEQTFYYRSQSLISPDHRYAAYSRIQLRRKSEIFRSQVSSVLFIENLHTGDLQAITASSPFANNPFADTVADHSGTISIVIPIAWSPTGDRLLAREFESLFCSDLASDYAVVLDCQHNAVSTLAPTSVHYSHAILLGWSQNHPGRVLFRAGTMGEEDWHLWAVDLTGDSQQADEDVPITHGEYLNSIWTGPQQAPLAG